MVIFMLKIRVWFWRCMHTNSRNSNNSLNTQGWEEGVYSQTYINKSQKGFSFLNLDPLRQILHFNS
uniref:Uncharacterized protein n=1 Tax=Rhizophora mucronata TaxID=61149 RepID=A0A2P2PN02_RHIMU